MGGRWSVSNLDLAGRIMVGIGILQLAAFELRTERDREKKRRTERSGSAGPRCCFSSALFWGSFLGGITRELPGREP